MNKCLILLVTIALLASFVACSGEKTPSVTPPSDGTIQKEDRPTNAPEMDLGIDLRQVAKEDLGAMMPKILFVDAENDRVGFWGTFGLFVINLKDASVHRAFNIAALGLNQMGGEEITRFLVSEDYNKIYMFNEGENEENVEDVFYYYNVEEDKLRLIPVGTGVEVLPPIPVFDLEFVGGEQRGYTSGVAYVGEDQMVYLQSINWAVKDLTLCKYNPKTEETERLPIFDSRKKTSV